MPNEHFHIDEHVRGLHRDVRAVIHFELGRLHQHPGLLEQHSGLLEQDQMRTLSKGSRNPSEDTLRSAKRPLSLLTSPLLLELYSSLDAIVNVSVSSNLHMGWKVGAGALWSIAATPRQTEYYLRAAAHPSVRTICEVGFNAGHSTAVWLAASRRTTRVYSFDRMQLSYSRASLALLQKLFPGRLEMSEGDSDRSVPNLVAQRCADDATRSLPKCDLISIDGGHDEFTTLHDVLNMLPLANPRGATVLFDDIGCKSAGCKLPSCAVKALVAARFLEPVDLTTHGSDRGWGLFAVRGDAVRPFNQALCSGLANRSIRADARGKGSCPAKRKPPEPTCLLSDLVQRFLAVEYRQVSRPMREKKLCADELRARVPASNQS